MQIINSVAIKLEFYFHRMVVTIQELLPAQMVHSIAVTLAMKPQLFPHPESMMEFVTVVMLLMNMSLVPIV